MTIQIVEGTVEAITLERSEVQATGWGLFCRELVLVALPEHTEIHVIGRVMLEPLRVQTRQIIRFSLTPQVVEPVDDFPDHPRLVVAQVQLKVAGEAGVSEVAAARQHPVRTGFNDVSFAVQELPGQPSHLYFL